jgi:putative transposase
MPRRRLIRSANFPYHVFGKSNYDEWFPCPISEVWECFASELASVSIAYGIRPHAFVLMSNHYHLVASTPEANLDQCLQYLLREVARRLNFKSGSRGHRFNGPYQSRLVGEPTYYRRLIRYVYMNPVNARLAKDPVSYKFSTLGRIQGRATCLRFPIWPHPFEEAPTYRLKISPTDSSD